MGERIDNLDRHATAPAELDIDITKRVDEDDPQARQPTVLERLCVTKVIAGEDTLNRLAGTIQVCRMLALSPRVLLRVVEKGQFPSPDRRTASGASYWKLRTLQTWMSHPKSQQLLTALDIYPKLDFRNELEESEDEGLR